MSKHGNKPIGLYIVGFMETICILKVTGWEVEFCESDISKAFYITKLKTQSTRAGKQNCIDVQLAL